MRRLYRRIKAVLHRVLGVTLLESELARVRAELRHMHLRLDDLILLGRNGALLFDAPGIALETRSPVAAYSDDYKHPRGAAQDNTRYPRFVRKSEQILGNRISFLDVGCAGGGLVFDFLMRGHIAIGLEGSDYPLKQQAGCWPLIPQHLFTCDATEPYALKDSNGRLAQFNLISAWEVLEHIPEDRLKGFLSNIREHLAPGGMFVGSVATFPDFDAEKGTVWHVTLHEREWWREVFGRNGLETIDSPYDVLDFPRGSGNPYMVGDWSVATDPSMGFHVVARRKEQSSSGARL